MSSNEPFNVKVINPTTKEVVGYVPAEKWTDPLSGLEYDVPVGYNPIHTIQRFSSVSADTDIQLPGPLSGTLIEKKVSEAEQVGEELLTDVNQLRNYGRQGIFDLQRSSLSGESYGGFVPSFQKIASFDYGLAAKAAGLPSVVILAAAGGHNANARLINSKIDISGALFNNPDNVPHILAGISYGETSSAVCIADTRINLGSETLHSSEPLKTQSIGKPVSEVLPTTHASMAQGADAIGERSEISRIAVERTGLAVHDPRNNMSMLMQEANRPTGHLLVLEDGNVQGPESGAVPFASNPQIAAGKNGGTLGILYAGTGAMNDVQWKTVCQVRDWLGQQRGAEGLPTQTELIAGSTATAEILNLPTPRGPLPETAAPQPGIAPAKPRQVMGNSGGMPR